MIDIPLKVKDPTRKYKALGIIGLIIGIVLFGYTILFFIRIPNAQIVVIGMIGLAIAVVGGLVYVFPSIKMTKYFFNRIRKPGGKDLQPVFILDEFIELYELYGKLYYQIGDYKRSEIFYGIMVLLKQQRYDPEIMQTELIEARKLIRKTQDAARVDHEKIKKK
jgi:hypothetical protein